ncbi:hypothetical protein [Candidatus Palauibacter sp.]|uniref:hypothetical protein n=1 Tax=Candidatus Palauibacter sp. TaxID=3101350 RepID=UPI003B02849C
MDPQLQLPVAVYVLNPSQERRAVLLDEVETGGSVFRKSPFLAEPVPVFKYPQRLPLVVFLSLDDHNVSHMADGTLGLWAGTGLKRLELRELEPLSRPISFGELESQASSSVRWHLRERLVHGGLLPEKTRLTFLTRIIQLDEVAARRLARYERRERIIQQFSGHMEENLALQKETVGLALRLAGISTDQELEWDPSGPVQKSFLDGLRGARVYEDEMLFQDHSTFPGLDLRGMGAHASSLVFESEADPSLRMTVIMANRLPLEHQTGADLIYFNEKYASFVIVQYKAMKECSDGWEFRWSAGDSFTSELQRMERVWGAIEDVESDDTPDGFRFSTDPLFLKFCPRVAFDPERQKLFSGMYLPVYLWKRLERSRLLRGPRGGKRLTFDNVGRWLNNTEFIHLVKGSWLGTSGTQSKPLGELVRDVLARRAVTVAVKHGDPRE